MHGGRREDRVLVKVYGGTTVGEGESLCDTCRHSRIVRGRRLDEEIVFCNALYAATIRITFKVTTCTDYVDDREPSYNELMEKAWILRPASKRRAAGFVRAADLRGVEAMRIFDDPTDPD
jgi:hypothetical protein